MKSITIYLIEGKIKDHFKKNYGKYLAGAAVASLAVPEVTGALIEKSASNDRRREYNKTFVKPIDYINPDKYKEYQDKNNKINKKDELGTIIRPSTLAKEVLDKI